MFGGVYLRTLNSVIGFSCRRQMTPAIDLLFHLMHRWVWVKDFTQSFKNIFNMARSRSVSPSPRELKRQKIDHLTKEDFKNGLFLAPMVRSGCRECYSFIKENLALLTHKPVPTRLFALKHGATLVWGPEMVDKAMLHATREVDRMPYHFALTSTSDSFIYSCNRSHILQRGLSRHLHNPPRRKALPHLPNRLSRPRAGCPSCQTSPARHLRYRLELRVP